MYRFHSFYFFFLLFYFFYAFLVNTAYSKIRDNDSRRKISFLLLLFLPLFLLSALRGEMVGGDLEYYLPYFDRACQASSFQELMDISGHEPGYIILTGIIGSISSSHRFFFFITTIFSLIGPFYLIYRYSEKPIVSIIIYYAMGFYTNTFNNIRQSIAMSIIFFAFPYLFNKSSLKFFVFLFIATLIHYSAFVFLIVYVLIKMNSGIKSAVFTFIIGTIIFVVLGSNLMSFFVGIINLIVLKYDNFDVNESPEVGWGLLMLQTIIFLALLFVFYRLRKSAKQNQLFFLKLILFFQMMTVLIQMYATIFPSMTRMSQYFFIPVMVLSPFLFSLIRKKILKMYYGITLLSLSLLFFYLTYGRSPVIDSNSQGVIPYYFLETKIF